jgi:hypothetical protein
MELNHCRSFTVRHFNALKGREVKVQVWLERGFPQRHISTPEMGKIIPVTEPENKIPI